jgi:hypothetical protein
VRGPESLLDHLLPRFDLRQVHEAWVPAPADVVYSAVKQVTGREVRVLRPLGFMRRLPGLLIGRRPFWPDPSSPLLAGVTAGVVSLGERAGREVVAGAIGRFWRTVGNEAAPVRTPQISLPSPNLATRRRRLRSPSFLSGRGLASRRRRALLVQAPRQRGCSAATGS